MKRIFNAIRKAPFYTKYTSDGFMWASVYNSQDIRLYISNNAETYEIEPIDMTYEEAEFCEQARREALKEMCEY